MKNSPEVTAWLSEQFKKAAETQQLNPLVRAYGPGPEGAKCKTCRHLFRKRMSKVYIKCELRANTCGPGTDHRANWPACAKYSPEPETL